jgi:hypothetical protein
VQLLISNKLLRERRTALSASKSRAAAAAAVFAVGAGTAGVFAASSAASARITAAAAAPTAPAHLTARRLRPRRGAVPRGTVVGSTSLVGNRVFANSRDGFALADDRQAQYPARTLDGGRTWRIIGPQLHVDAADGPEAVSAVGVAHTHTLFAYGSSVVDVSTNGGRTWWETFLGSLVVAVVPGRSSNELVAYVQRSASNAGGSPAVTLQYVSRDGGRHWNYSTAMGG